MDKEHVKGGAKEAAGKLKKGAGKTLDDKEMEMEGRRDEAEGKIRKGVGDVKDFLKGKDR